MLPQKAQPGTNINYLSLFASKLGCAWHYFNSSLPDTRCIPGFHYRFLRLPSWRLKVSSVQRRALDWTSLLRGPWFHSKAAQAAAAPQAAENCFGKKTLKFLTSCDRSCVGDGRGLAETWEKELVTWCKPDGFALTLQKPEAGRNPPGTYQNPAKPAEPGGTPRNPAEPGGNLAETWRKPGGTRRKKSKLKGGVVGSITFGMAYTPNRPPLQLTFFPPGFRGFRQVPPGSAGFPRGSAGFRGVPRGSAGFRRVPPGSAGFRRVPPGSARFRLVPGLSPGQFRRLVPGSAVSANKVPATDPPFNSLLGLCQVLARRLSRLQQSKKRFLQVPGHCPSRLMEKNTSKMAFLVEYQILFAVTPWRWGCNIDFRF